MNNANSIFTCSVFKFRRFRFFPNTRDSHETRGNIPDRDHLSFRGHYYPQKAVIDGDLCETFRQIEFSKK